MNIDFVSDLHVEMNRNWVSHPEYDGVGYFYPWHIERKSNVLIIAGDTSNSPQISMSLIDEASQYYEYVIWTDGNHEHYNDRKLKSTVDDDNSLFCTQSERNRPASLIENNITYLNNGKNDIQIGDTLFIGGNGWYDWTSNQFYSRDMQMQFWKSDMNDSKVIRFNTNGFPDKMARRHAERLRKRVEKAQHDDTVKDIVLITHTIPERTLGYSDHHQFGYLNGSYVNMFSRDIVTADVCGKIKIWIYGHTHVNEDRVIDNIRYVNNARGYFAHNTVQRENNFSGLKCIDVSETMIGSAFGSIE